MKFNDLFKVKTAHILLLVISILSLASAYTAQYGFDLKPCQFCLWERYPYWLMILLAVAALIIKRLSKLLLLMGLLVFIVSAGITSYHVAIEHKWVPIPESCQSKIVLDDTPTYEELREQLMAQEHVTRCDIVPFRFLGLSIAEWNLVLNLGLIAYIILTFRRIRRLYE
jgi:disulfide bond formation protein DsbB